eukprot:166240_1
MDNTLKTVIVRNYVVTELEFYMAAYVLRYQRHLKDVMCLMASRKCIRIDRNPWYTTIQEWITIPIIYACSKRRKLLYSTREEEAEGEARVNAEFRYNVNICNVSATNIIYSY